MEDPSFQLPPSYNVAGFGGQQVLDIMQAKPLDVVGSGVGTAGLGIMVTLGCGLAVGWGTARYNGGPEMRRIWGGKH